ncbi:MAG: class I SAM-dependent methyltransferase [Candidatus Omnitrophota bacterium]
MWKEQGFQVTGVEASLMRSQRCREKYGLDVFTGFIEEFNSDEKFDVITMRHILEHIENPIAVLEKVKSLLKDDGVLSITVPNINSIGRYIFQEKHAWVLPWHLHFYYPKTLTALIERVGFSKVKIYQKPGPLWYPNSLMDCFHQCKIVQCVLTKVPRFILMLLFAPVVLAGCIFHLSDNLTILAKKRG